MVKMKFEGGSELIKAMEALSPRVSKNVLKAALEDAAEPMRAKMSRLAPRDPDPIDLADNIVIGNVRAKSDGGQAATVAIGPAKGFFYGFYQEFGTVHHSAQPFMRPAWDSGVSRAIADIGRAMWTALASRGISRSSTVDTPVQGDGRLL